MKFLYKMALGVIASVALSTSAVAANYQAPASQTSNYAGFNVGTGGAFIGPFFTTNEMNGEAIYFSGYFGHNFNKYIAAEGGFGYVTGKLVPLYLPYAAAKFTLPLDRFDIFAKAGIGYIGSSQQVDDYLEPSKTSPIGLALFTAGGFGFHLTPKLSLNAEVQMYEKMVWAVTISGGLSYSF